MLERFYLLVLSLSNLKYYYHHEWTNEKMN